MPVVLLHDFFSSDVPLKINTLQKNVSIDVIYTAHIQEHLDCLTTIMCVQQAMK